MTDVMKGFAFIIALSSLLLGGLRADVTFDGQVNSIIQAKCIKCHGGFLPQGGLKLNSHKNALKGGKSGKVIIPGNAEGSILYKQFFLPTSSPQHMPPIAEPQLTSQEISTIKSWIDGGAK